MKKQKKEDQQLIRALLGQNKFIMLNLKMVQVIGIEPATHLTFILDKLEHQLGWDDDVLENGTKIFRKEVENKFGWGEKKQRSIEKKLVDMDLLKVIKHFDGITTFNTYSVDLVRLYNLLEENNK